MGDVAMTVPVLRAFTEKYPDVKITVLTKETYKPFFRDLLNVSLFCAEVNGKHKNLFGLYKLSKELKNLGIEAVADLHNVLRSNILKFFFFGNRVVQIDKGRVEKKALVTGVCFEQLKTTHQRYVDVFETLGFKLNLSNPTFPQKAILSNNTKSVIGVIATKLIGIAPFAAHEGKMYPLNEMKLVI